MNNKMNDRMNNKMNDRMNDKLVIQSDTIYKKNDSYMERFKCLSWYWMVSFFSWTCEVNDGQKENKKC